MLELKTVLRSIAPANCIAYTQHMQHPPSSSPTYVVGMIARKKTSTGIASPNEYQPGPGSGRLPGTYVSSSPYYLGTHTIRTALVMWEHILHGDGVISIYMSTSEDRERTHCYLMRPSLTGRRRDLEKQSKKPDRHAQWSKVTISVEGWTCCSYSLDSRGDSGRAE